MESLEEAERKGYDAFRRGEVIKPAPNPEDYYDKKDPLALESANLYYTRWVMGFEKAQQEAV